MCWAYFLKEIPIRDDLNEKPGLRKDKQKEAVPPRLLCYSCRWGATLKIPISCFKMMKNRFAKVGLTKSEN